jgi:hypothetical protein
MKLTGFDTAADSAHRRKVNQAGGKKHIVFRRLEGG